MLLVEIEKPENRTLAAWFSELRSWLDDNRCEPKIFAQAGGRIDPPIYRISFETAEQAQNFAGRFANYAPMIRRPATAEDIAAEAMNLSRAAAVS
jgi:CRISPR/Cas system endoribonuclease Cas6 (RAMP superfamily)